MVRATEARLGDDRGRLDLAPPLSRDLTRMVVVRHFGPSPGAESG